MYKHDPTALLVFCLVAMICLTVFVVFYTRNLKPQARRNASMLHIARLISAELYRVIPAARHEHRCDAAGNPVAHLGLRQVRPRHRTRRIRALPPRKTVTRI